MVQPVQIPEALQKKAGVNAAGGLLVMHVEAAGPADSAGVLLGDIVVDMDSGTVDHLEDLQDTLLHKGIGKEVHAVVIRGGQRVQLTIRVGERPPR
jgi:S1-C subfamily serine protease